MLFIYQSDSIKGIISTFFIKKLVEEENFDEIEYDPRLHFPFDVWFSDISYEISLLRLRLHKWKLLRSQTQSLKFRIESILLWCINFCKFWSKYCLTSEAMNIYHIEATFFKKQNSATFILKSTIYIKSASLYIELKTRKIFLCKKAQISFKKLHPFKRMNFLRLYLCNLRFCFLFLMQVAILHEPIGWKKT